MRSFGYCLRMTLRIASAESEAAKDKLIQKISSFALPKNVSIELVVLFKSVGQSPVGREEVHAAQVFRMKFRQGRRLIHAQHFLLPFIGAEIVHKKPGCGRMMRFSKNRGG